MKKTLGLPGTIFSEEQLNHAIKNNLLLNLQIAIPCACLNDCIYCFQASGKVGDKEMDTKEIIDVIDQIAEMGAIYIQFLGKGEPMLNKDFLYMVEYCHKKGLYTNLFTCGDVLGNDSLAQKIYGMSGLDIIKKLKKLNISIFIKYEKENQDDISQRKGYSKMRNEALKRLIAAGFNATEPTRLGLTPVILSKNYSDLRGIFRWGLENNIYPHLCVLIPSGKTKQKFPRALDITHEQLISLAIDNIKEAIDRNYDYLGPTPFPGGLHCHYLRIGLYLDNFGDIYMCSGEDSNPLGNIRNKKIKDIWLDSYNLRKKFIKGHGCPWKEKIGVIPSNYYKAVDEEVKKYIGRTKG